MVIAAKQGHSTGDPRAAQVGHPAVGVAYLSNWPTGSQRAAVALAKRFQHKDVPELGAEERLLSVRAVPRWPREPERSRDWFAEQWKAATWQVNGIGRE